MLDAFLLFDELAINDKVRNDYLMNFLYLR